MKNLSRIRKDFFLSMPIGQHFFSCVYSDGIFVIYLFKSHKTLNPNLATEKDRADNCEKKKVVFNSASFVGIRSYEMSTD